MDLAPKILEIVIRVGDREFSSFGLTPAEADAMLGQGFRFAAFNRRAGRFELEPPFGLSGDRTRGTWTFRQER